jgi:hypothetical protein
MTPRSSSRRAIAALALASALACLSPAAVAESNPRFQKAAELLDQGGEYYYFSDTKGDLSAFFVEANKSLSGVPGAPLFLGLARAALEELDVLGVEARGASSVDLGEFNRTKWLLLNSGERKGIFLALGGEPHASATLSYAPADATYFMAEDVDIGEFLDLVRRVAGRVAGPNGDRAIDEALEGMRAHAGFDLPGLAASIAGEVAVIAWVPKELTYPLPPIVPGAKPAFVPETRFVLLVPSSDGALFEAARGILGGSEIDAGDSAPRIVAAATASPDGTSSRLCYADDGSRFLISSHLEWLVATLDASRGDAPRLADDAEFRRVSAGLPIDAANGWSFVRATWWDSLQDTYEGIKAIAPEPQLATFIDVFSRLATSRGSSARVRVNHEGGLLTIRHGNPIPIEEILSAGDLTIAPIMVAIAIPGFIRARDASRVRAIQADLRRIDDATQQWIIEHNLDVGDPLPTLETLVNEGYLRAMPVPPIHGAYATGKSVPPPGATVPAECYPSFQGPNAAPHLVHPDLLRDR